MSKKNPHTIQITQIASVAHLLAASASASKEVKELSVHVKIEEESTEVYFSVFHNKKLKIFEKIQEAIEYYNSILL